MFMKYGMEGEDGVFTIKGENTLLNSTGQQAAMMNIGTLCSTRILPSLCLRARVCQNTQKLTKP